QERYNARFVEQQGVGVVAGGWQGMAEAALELCRDRERLDGLRRKLDRLPENRAVWELLAALGGIVEGVVSLPSMLGAGAGHAAATKARWTRRATLPGSEGP